MFDINPLDTRPGEAELLAVGAAYFANRLLSRGHRRQIEIAINITTQPMRVPIPRSMLSTNDGVLRRKLPQNFAFSVSVASGMRNAMELIAHEIIHIAQVLYRRLIITWRILPQRMSDRVVYQARWENGRAMPMGQLEWAVRPWEIEASRWQSILVDEFLAYSTGQLHSLPLQRPRKRQLALFDIGRDATPPPRVNAISSLARISQCRLLKAEHPCRQNRRWGRMIRVAKLNCCHRRESELTCLACQHPACLRWMPFAKNVRNLAVAA